MELRGDIMADMAPALNQRTRGSGAWQGVLLLTAALEWWERLDRPLARLPRAAALAVLAALAAALIWSAMAVHMLAPAAPLASAVQQPGALARGDEASVGDLALYRRISERVIAGENYYTAALAEQRADDYPVRPFVTVRLPLLAWLHAALGFAGVRYLALALAGACLLAWHRRLETCTSLPQRAGALMLLVMGGLGAGIPQAALVHEIYAGLFLTLAAALYRPDRIWPSLLAAASALALRELCVAFVLLWLVLALASRRGREAAALGLLLTIFVAGLYLHYLAVSAELQPGDPGSQGWSGLAGYGLPLLAVIRLTALMALPQALAAPLALLPLLGWLALGGRAGLFMTLWFAGYFTAVAVFARPENFYWMQLILPAYLMGLAFVPRALGELARSAFVGASRPAPVL